MDLLPYLLKNIMEALGLLFRGAKNIIDKTIVVVLVEVFD